jgi:transposase
VGENEGLKVREPALENKVALAFVEGLNNTFRVLPRRVYGLRDEEYLRLKILTCMLPRL